MKKHHGFDLASKNTKAISSNSNDGDKMASFPCFYYLPVSVAEQFIGSFWKSSRIFLINSQLNPKLNN